MILKCSNPKCKDINTPAAQYQTEQYGSGKRVHNPKGGKGNEKKAGCTICGLYTDYNENDLKNSK